MEKGVKSQLPVSQFLWTWEFSGAMGKVQKALIGGEWSSMLYRILRFNQMYIDKWSSKIDQISES